MMTNDKSTLEAMKDRHRAGSRQRHEAFSARHLAALASAAASAPVADDLPADDLLARLDPKTDPFNAEED